MSSARNHAKRSHRSYKNNIQSKNAFNITHEMKSAKKSAFQKFFEKVFKRKSEKQNKERGIK